MSTSPEKVNKRRRMSSSSNGSTRSSISLPSSFGNSSKSNESLLSPNFSSEIKNSHSPSHSSNGKNKKSVPYIPSYMDLTNGPEPCVVCGDAATGYHYRCMTCEGCKGFFRRTIQKNLQYHCKWENDCLIDKNTRNQCQQCRYRKCVRVGMATDLVLNERQRVAKRKLIEDNRVRRRQEQSPLKNQRNEQNQETCNHEDDMTADDRNLLSTIVTAYSQTTTTNLSTNEIEKNIDPPEQINSLILSDQKTWRNLAEAITPSIMRVVEFAKKIPNFVNLDIDDQILLLKSSCMEIMCLQASCENNETLENDNFTLLIEPIREFANGLAKLQLDETELALLSAILLVQADIKGLKNQEKVEFMQDSILNVFKKYIGEKRPFQPIYWAKVLMKVTDLRAITSKHAEKIINLKEDLPMNNPQPIQVNNIFQTTPNIQLKQFNTNYMQSFSTWPWHLQPMVPNYSMSKS